jgi:hypothetical protein
VLSVAEQIAWSLQEINERGKELLEEAEYHSAAAALEPSLIQAGLDAIKAHLKKEGDLRSKAVKESLIAA